MYVSYWYASFLKIVITVLYQKIFFHVDVLSIYLRQVRLIFIEKGGDRKNCVNCLSSYLKSKKNNLQICLTTIILKIFYFIQYCILSQFWKDLYFKLEPERFNFKCYNVHTGSHWTVKYNSYNSTVLKNKAFIFALMHDFLFI
jgi:hypothetical protein